MTVETEADPDVDAVTVDPARLKQVLWARVSNAVAFTPAAGRVVVPVRAEGADAFRIEVQDSGPAV